MERPFEYVADINDKKDLWKLAVKVKDKWTMVKDGREHLELVIADAKGNDIQVIIPTAYKAIYDKILLENSTYTLSNFQVSSNDLVFKATDHKFVLKWTGGTTAVDVNAHDIPDHLLKFKPFAEIVAGKWRPDLLYNVIGVVQDMGYCQLNEGAGKKLQVNFTMKDLSDISLNCTLWEEYAGKFIEFNTQRKGTGPVVVLLKYGKVKEEGRFPLSVSNTYSFTKLFINDDIPEIKKFMMSLPKEDQVYSNSQLVCTQSQGSSQFNSIEDLLCTPLILPLSLIVALDQISYCLTVATIEKVNSTKHGWYYLACHKCPKIAKGDKPPYTCDSGHNTETEIVRYKLEVEASYQFTKTTFVLWDAEVSQLLGISASQLRLNMISAGITNRLEYPLVMDSIAEKNVVAKVKWQPRWKTCSVICLKEGPSFVQQVESKFPNWQVDEPIHVEEAIDHNVPSEDPTNSVVDVSATSEYDPEASSQVTPVSTFKSADFLKDVDTLSQMTPFSNNSLSVDADKHVSGCSTPAATNAVYAAAHPAPPKDDTTPARHSSSKRVKLIKQEKK